VTDCSPGKYAIDPEEAVELVDENTILFVTILGTTYTGEYEDTEGCSKLLDAKCKKVGYEVYIHVDAASGGFVAPFVSPELKWDFRLPRVCSINVSGHKYGLAYAGTLPLSDATLSGKALTFVSGEGVGWAIWRNKDFLPEELIFTVDCEYTLSVSIIPLSATLVVESFSLPTENFVRSIRSRCTSTILHSQFLQVGHSDCWTVL
jgi:glutamate decarboxylase